VTDKPHDGAAPSLPPDETLEVDSQPHESSVDHPVLHSWTESDGAGATEVMNSVDGATSIGSARTTSASDEVSAPAPANPRPKQGTRIHSARPTAGEFYVVGVGASAGGLEALESFFSPMPSDTGMAFVVVQHLSPDFRSVMDELLARWTQIPIHRVVDGMQVEPNAIYLIPPKKDMIISGGKLLLTDKEPGQGLTLPIDIFLRSLAHDAGSRAIGVILSGTGSDGSRGICEIHDAGGLVLVQDPDSAKFDGMPKSAVETGVVDAICRPIEMASNLLAYIEHPAVAEYSSLLPASPQMLQGFDAIFQLLRKEYGIDFSYYKRSTVTRRVHRRVQMNQIVDLNEYVDRLRNDPAELNSLYKDLLIGVTRFFRDAEAFDRLEHRILPQLFGKLQHENDELRVWIAGCATGEEAYSIAILIHEQLDRLSNRYRAKVFATDVHRASLEVASAGIYSEESLAEVSAERRARYFTHAKHGYQVSQELRQMVVFAPHNIIRDAPFTKLDLVTCRNLLIYLEPLAQKKALALFHFALHVGGVLLLGPSESPGELADEFDTIDERWRFYSKRRDRRLHTDMRLPMTIGLAPSDLERRANLLAPARRAPDQQILRAYDALLADFAPPSLLINEDRELVQSFGGAAQFLQLRDGRVSTDILELLHHDLRLPVSTALQQAAKGDTPVMLNRITVRDPQGIKYLKLTIKPLVDAQRRTTFFLLTLEPVSQPTPVVAEQDGEFHLGHASDEQLVALESELRLTKENLQSMVEEMETSNEELQATNEELVASNEELQSTNEELHSVNEELYTVNAEYQKKIVELTELTADMDNLLFSTDVGVIFLDRELCIRKFTPQVGRAFHLLPADIGRHIESFAPRIDRPELVADLTQVLKTGEPIEVHVEDRDDTPFFLRILPYRSRGAIDGVVLTLINISRLVTAEQELRLMSKVFRDGADPILIEDLKGQILNLNAEAERAYGWSREELLGAPSEKLVPAAELLRARELRQRCLEKSRVRNVETWRQSKSGEARPILLTLSLLTDSENQPVAVASIAKDIADRKRAEEEVRASLVRRDQFLAMLSHELRNPLGAILNASYLIEGQGVSTLPAPVATACQIVQRQSLQVARLLDDLLDVARVTQGKIEVRRDVLDLTSLVDDVVQSVAPLMKSREHKLEVSASPGPILVEGDAARLLQIQINLLANAAKYTPAGGIIRYRVVKEDDEAIIGVADNGRGIPAELLDKIFDLFVQSDETLDRAHGGMGIGLTLVKTLVELHHGSVTAQSAGLGQGSEFVVRLPLAAPRQAAVLAPAAPGKARPDAHILIVEDNFDSRAMLEALLKLDGYRVTVADDGQQGLEAIRTRRPDVAIVDIGLPIVSGYDLARRVRNELGDSHIVLIALTGYGRNDDRQAALAAGFNAHLTKPLKPEELARLLVTLLPPANNSQGGVNE
jgi:two-component system CheB/CheR fusion protein